VGTGTHQSGRRALVVDDDPGVRDFLSRALGRWGVQVESAATLDEAQSHLEGRNFQLVLTDLVLASSNEGLAVARSARRLRPKAKVVLFSGHDLESVADEAAQAGVDELLAKPLSLATLERLLADLGVDQATTTRSRSVDDAAGQELLQRFASGDTQALERLVACYTPMVYSVFLRWFQLSMEDAQDLYQEVMLQLIRCAGQIRNVRMWLLGTAINQARKCIRTLIRNRKLAERYLENLELCPPDEDEDLRELIARGLSALRPFDRRLLKLIYIDGLSYQEVGAALGRPLGSIGPLRGRALKRLTQAIVELESPHPQRQVEAA
jgi:RNA polymerase sigma factor (sigma-70 family)